MSLPKRGSRTVDVEGKTYRYLFRKREDAHETSQAALFIQQDCDEPGNILEVSTTAIEQSYTGLGPGDVRQVIEQSLAAGWEPAKKGPPIKLGIEYKIERKVLEVAVIQVKKHNPGPCRHCGHVFENGCCGRDECPTCGCPVKKPDNV